MEDVSDYKHITSINSNYLPHDFVLHRRIVWNIDNFKEFKSNAVLEIMKRDQAKQKGVKYKLQYPKLEGITKTKLCEHIEILMTVEENLEYGQKYKSIKLRLKSIQQVTALSGEQCVCNSLCMCIRCDKLCECYTDEIRRCPCCDYMLLTYSDCMLKSDDEELWLRNIERFGEYWLLYSDDVNDYYWDFNSDKITIGDKLSIQFKLKFVFTVKRRSFVNHFKKFIGNECFNDFSMICSDGIKVVVNSIILATCSPVFKAMLQSDMIEKQKKEIVIIDIESGTMQELINFLYSGCVANLDNYAELLLYAADKYQIMGLKYVCITHFQKHLEPENAFDVLQLADFYNLKLLYAECIGLIWSTHDDVKELAEFKSLSTQLQEKVIAERETIIIEIISKYEQTSTKKTAKSS